MTENTKVSAIAFSVLILGMLGFFVALAADIFFSPSAPAVVTPPTPTLPREAPQGVMQGHAHIPYGIHQNFQFNVTGNGQVLPEERAEHVEMLICYRMSFEHASPKPAGSWSRRIGERAGRSIGV